ncbi:hypothetical protein Tco_1102294 [Tanacetum coccineum]
MSRGEDRDDDGDDDGGVWLVSEYGVRVAAVVEWNAQGTPINVFYVVNDSSLMVLAEVQGTANSQGTAKVQGVADIPHSPNDYTPTDASQTSGGDEGLLDLYALNREVRRLKKQTFHKLID